MPPSRMTGVISAQTAPLNASPDVAAARRTAWRGRPWRGAMIADHDHQRHAHQHARNDAGEEQTADRCVGAHAVNDHRQARRNDRPDGGGGRADRRRRLRPIAGLLHRADFDRAGPRGIGDRRAAPCRRRSCSTGCWRGHSRRASQPTSDVAKRDDAVGELRCVQDVAHQDEQRRGDERERVHRLRHLLRHDRARQSRRAARTRTPPIPSTRTAGIPSRMATSQTPTISSIRCVISVGLLPVRGRGERSRASASASSRAPCAAVTTPASTIGTYIHAMVIGSDVASRSWFLRDRGRRRTT